MPSHSKIEANRRNSQLSTGPRSDAGKLVVARNACKHNLTSLNIAIAGEDLEEFQILLHETAIDLVPRSTIENALVQQIAYAEWKLLRIAQWETDLINAAMSDARPIARSCSERLPPKPSSVCTVTSPRSAAPGTLPSAKSAFTRNRRHRRLSRRRSLIPSLSC